MDAKCIEECLNLQWTFRSVSGITAKSKIELLKSKINGLKPLALVTKRSILDFVVVADASVIFAFFCSIFTFIFDSIFLALCREIPLEKYFDHSVMLLMRRSSITDWIKNFYRLL